jgi:ribosomal protein S18 acetylase RimI-like enzyme
MKIREATSADQERLRELYREFVYEIPPPADLPIDLEHELRELEHFLDLQQVVLVAETDEGELAGFALGKLDDHPGIGYLSDLYVQPGARRQGAARTLIREVATRLRDRGAQVLTLEVQLDNQIARAAYERLGLREHLVGLYAPIGELLERSSREPQGESFGSAHVQTDDRDAVEQAVRKYIPRFGQSGGSAVLGPRNGWISVYDELCDREPAVLRRLGSELSNATGAVTVTTGIEEGAVVRYIVFERGSIVDEYLSMPEYYKPLPPGDTIALGANATVVARLTGADAAAFRHAAKTAAMPAELPPPSELLHTLAELMGIEGGEHGYETASADPNAMAVAHR